MVRQGGERSQWFYAGAAAWGASCVVMAVTGFGAIAFMLSIFLCVYTFGFREKYEDDSPSAYSVFNEGGRSIPGTFRVVGAGFSQLATAEVDELGRAGFAEGAAPKDATPRANLTDDERLRRREAAAAAAERRRAGLASDGTPPS